MPQTLTLDLPDEVYDSLLKKAEREGTAPASLVSTWLAITLKTFSEDPLLQLGGCFDGGPGDVGARHDYYIGEALARELRPDK